MKVKIIKAILIVILLISLFFALNRCFYGTWDIFGYPDRIQCFGRRYYKPQQDLKLDFSISDYPRYPVYSLNLLMGKRIYTKEPVGEFVPTVIYLYDGNGQYVPYALSGGP